MHRNALIGGDEHPTLTGARPTVLDHSTVVAEQVRGHTELADCDSYPSHQQPDGFVTVAGDCRGHTLAVNHVEERT